MRSPKNCSKYGGATRQTYLGLRIQPPGPGAWLSSRKCPPWDRRTLPPPVRWSRNRAAKPAEEWPPGWKRARKKGKEIVSCGWWDRESMWLIGLIMVHTVGVRRVGHCAGYVNICLGFCGVSRFIWWSNRIDWIVRMFWSIFEYRTSLNGFSGMWMKAGDRCDRWWTEEFEEKTESENYFKSACLFAALGEKHQSKQVRFLTNLMA